jgi:hypothetical protein
MKARLAQYETGLSEIEQEVAKMREKEKALKREFAHELSHGKPTPSTIKREYNVQPRNVL